MKHMRTSIHVLASTS